MVGNHVIIKRSVPCCGATVTVVVPAPAFKEWDSGNTPLEVAWPEGDDNQRAVVMKGRHVVCPITQEGSE